MKIVNNTVLITGGASGIGLSLAQRFARAGNKVLIVGRNAAKLKQACKLDARLVPLQYDIASDQDRTALADHLKTHYPELNVLINNAGIQRQCRFDGEPPSMSDIRAEMETNFFGPVELSALLVPALRKRPEAAIVNISSALALAPKSAAPIYCCSKAALSVFSRTLRDQLAGTAVKVFDVMAPLVDTAMTAGRGQGKLSPDAFADALLAGMAANRFSMRIGKAKLLYALFRLSPTLVYRMMRDQG